MPFRKWFPKTLPEQADFYINFTRVFEEIYEDLGFDAEVLAWLKADNEVIQYLARMKLLTGVFRRSFRESVKNITYGKEGDVASFAQLADVPVPSVVPAGMFKRLFRLADRIADADGFNSMIGAKFGILPKTREPLRTEDLKLKLRAKIVGGAKIEVRFTRGRTSGIVLYFCRDGSDEWIELGRFFSSPIVVKIPLTEARKPELINLRGRYLIKNEAAGAFSPTVQLNVTP